VQKLLQEIIKEHKAIIFNGDGYSEAWHKEAAKRGLPNLRNTVEALEAVSGDKAAAALFEKYNVLTARELAAATRSTPSVTARMSTPSAAGARHRQVHDPARGLPLPGRAGLHRRRAEGSRVKSVDTRPRWRSSASLVHELEAGIVGLEHALAHKSSGSTLDHAKHYRDEVIPAMLTIRKVVDSWN
jgi:glutamine synthetase